MLLLLLTVLGNTREDSSKRHLFLVMRREYVSPGLDHRLSKSLLVFVIVCPDIKEGLSYLEIFHVHLSLLETVFIYLPTFCLPV